jgi:hypothetical protein
MLHANTTASTKRAVKLHVVSRSRLALAPAVRPRCRFATATAAATNSSDVPSALILEADGVVTDLHMDGHRVAFNRYVMNAAARAPAC